MKHFLLVSLFALSCSANAVTVSLDGTKYNLSVVEGNFDSLNGLLQEQPWWGDKALAETLSTTIKFNWGDIVYDYRNIQAPLFAYAREYSIEHFHNHTASSGWVSLGDGTGNGRQHTFGYPDSFTSLSYAVVSEVPLPAAMWLLGSALLGLSALKRKQST